MQTKYTIHTKIEGFDYTVCRHEKMGGFYIKHKPNDEEIVKWDDYESAQNMVDNQSGILKYEVVSVEIPA